MQTMATTKNKVDFYIMKVISVHLNAYGSSSIDNLIVLSYIIVVFSIHKITMPAIF